MIKIAISGNANSGKNTLATMLVKHLNLDEYSAKITALADPIKNIVLEMVPNADRNCLFGPSELRSKIINEDLKDKFGKLLTYRQLLIDIGKLGRSYNQDVWLNALVQDAKMSFDKKAYLISDVRFLNEINYFKRNEFYMIRIKRIGSPKIDDISETEQLSIHDNEFNAIVENYEGLEELNLKVKNLTKEINKAIYV